MEMKEKSKKQPPRFNYDPRIIGVAIIVILFAVELGWAGVKHFYFTPEREMCNIVRDLQSGSIESALNWAQETANHHWENGNNNTNVNLVSLSLSHEESAGRLFSFWESIGSENYPNFETRIARYNFRDPYTAEEIQPTLNENGTVMNVPLYNDWGFGYGTMTLFTAEMPEVSTSQFVTLPENEDVIWDTVESTIVELEIGFNPNSSYGQDFIMMYAEAYFNPTGTEWSPSLPNTANSDEYWWDPSFTLYDGANNTFWIYNWSDGDEQYRLWKFATEAYEVDPAFGHVVDCD